MSYGRKEMKKRNYAMEYENYGGTPEQKKRRAQRNKARREAIKEGRAHKGDGKDVHHKDYNPKNHGEGNEHMMDSGSNRSKNKHKKGEKQSSWK